MADKSTLGLRTALVGSAAALLLAGWSAPASGQLLLFAEDFEGLILEDSVDELPFPQAFTHEQPLGWERLANVPGVNDPLLGVTEWEGWSFASQEFWQIAGENDRALDLRTGFANGQGTFAVADPDQWDALGNPANSPEGGFYNTLIRTPAVPLDQGGTQPLRVKLGFDSTWFGGDCCDDGIGFTPPQPEPFSNNQTAEVRVSYADGSFETLLRWEAAPFLDEMGNPAADLVPGGMPNPDFKPPSPNERVWVEVPVPQGPGLPLTESGFGPAAGAAAGEGYLEFALGNAGDDGWWGVDNVAAYAISTLPGDMNINGMLDPGDVGAFALGLLDTNEYRNTYFGEFPVTRGSNDSTFDFDDIQPFVDLLEMGGVATSVEQVVALLNPVPEPATAWLLSLGLLAASRRRRVT